jgi:signal transduction histidine kinase
MEKQRLNPSRPGNGMDLAFAVVVLASYLATFSSIQKASLANIALLVLLGIIYVNLGIYGYSIASKSQSILERLVYFFIQIPIGGLIIFLGGGVGYNALVLLPLAGHSIVLLKSYWLIATNIAIGAAFVVTSALQGENFSLIWPNLLTFLAGQVFILVFTQMALDEQRSRKEVERLVQELQAANQQLRLYAVQVEELAITKERNRMAREIHDGLGHYLTTIHMQLMAGRAVSETNPAQADQLFLKAQNLTQEALADIRQSVTALRSSPVETKPLAEQVQRALDGVENLGLHGELIVLGEERTLPPQVDLTLFRAVQEGINNTCKHSKAEHIQICIDYSEPTQVGLLIQDDGIGTESTHGGFGLIGLQERVHQLGGEVGFETALDQGFRIKIRIPVKNDTHINR